MLIFNLAAGYQMAISVYAIGSVRNNNGNATLELNHQLDIGGTMTDEIDCTDAFQDVVDSLTACAFSSMPPSFFRPLTGQQ
jgi:hypothetical protein